MSERDIADLRLHEFAERVPAASNGDLRALRESLGEVGQQDPIDITSDGVILDGRTRWMVLRDLGATSIQVRVVDIPEKDQPEYIVHRALTRRHLTMEQKAQLNDLLRAQVVEEIPTDAGVIRVGLSRPERAARLGVSVPTVKEWDTGGSGHFYPHPPGPTHIRRGGGNTSLYPIHPTPPKERAVEEPRNGHARPRTPAKRVATAPRWLRHFTLWCRRARPEDLVFMRRMDTELHKAMTHIESTWHREN